MITLKGYTARELLHEGRNTLIYRGVRNSDQLPVIIKLLRGEYPPTTLAAKLRQEFEISSALDPSGVVRPLEIVDYENGPALVMEDFGGISLIEPIRAKKISLQAFLKIALRMSEILGQVHNQGVIHKDIKPHNIIINTRTGEIKLIDFGISTRLSRETQNLVAPTMLEGTLAYSSPEQTGRMNRPVDYRTDFYSLGVAFYEMLTGAPPFTSSDPMELVHCHIAVQPRPPHVVNAEVPQVISEIVMKLMAKNAEDRYQGAFGLKSDLQKCIDSLKRSGKVDYFEAGQTDVSERFQIPQKLYGREKDAAQLLETFEKVCAGQSALFEVVGPAGIGKSSLVHELQRPIGEKRGYFTTGKFDQFQRDVPYSALIQAFRELIRQFLTESAESVESWKARILEALGPNGALMVDVIPELQSIIGAQPPVAELAPTEAQNRFNETFRQFVRVFTQKEHPLVIFLDDLQWSDSATLKILNLLLGDPNTAYFFLIGSYREQDTPADHPLQSMLKDLKQAKVLMGKAILAPLRKEDVHALVAETVHTTAAKAAPLADLIASKTQGNPFFASELLKKLYNDKLINFDAVQGVWAWDLDRIGKVSMTDNVVELMSGTIKQLPAATQSLIRLAACIGNNFDLLTLSTVSEQTPVLAARGLEAALKEGILEPIGEDYKYVGKKGSAESDIRAVRYRFAHDRVQQTAYSLMHETDREKTHLSIGRHLLKQAGEALEEQLFDIANHMNLALGLITDPSEKKHVAELNLRAARKARASTAYEQALKFAVNGVRLLPESAWESDYDIMRDLHLQKVQLEYLNLKADDAEKTAEVVLAHAKNVLDRVAVYEQQVWYVISQGKYADAIEIGDRALRMLGVKLPRKPSMLSVVAALLKFNMALGRKKPEQLINQPLLNNPQADAAIRLLATLSAAFYIGEPNLLPIGAFTSVRIFIKEGYTVFHPFAIQTVALILGPGLGNMELGLKFARLGLQLLEKYPDQPTAGRSKYAFAAFSQHWQEPQQSTVAALSIAAAEATGVGDLEFTGWALHNRVIHELLAGIPLPQIRDENANLLSELIRMGQIQVARINAPMRTLLYDLLGEKDSHREALGREFSDEGLLETFIETNSRSGVSYTHLPIGIREFYFGRYAEAMQRFDAGEAYNDSIVGTMLLQDFYFYAPLSAIKLATLSESKTANRLLKRASKYAKKLKSWVKLAPMNFAPRFYIVEAELARSAGNETRAMAHYDKAIESARENGFIHLEALANELAADFYLSQGKEKVARTYLTDARYGYLRWGAAAKVRQLEEKYAQMMTKIRAAESLGRSSTTTTATASATETGSGTTTTSSLDISTVLKSSQALSGEIFLDRLLQKLMKITLENAGADRGLLILEKNGQMYVEAEGAADQAEVSNLLKSRPLDDDGALPTAIIRFVQRTGENIVLGDAAREGNFTQTPYVLNRKPKSVLCTPIKSKGKVMGILYLENNITSNAFTTDRIEILNILSSQAAISLENARLIAEETERQKLQKEMEMAKQVQMSILPRFPEDEAYRITAHMTPADQVGGDYYDYYRVGDDRWLAIGDVTGHGLNSGLMMLMAQTGFSTYLNSASQPDTVELFSALNRTLHMNMQDRTRQELYMTFTALRSDSQGNFEHVGKHEDILVWRKSTGKVEVIQSDGFWMGLVPDVKTMLQKAKFKLDSGDFLTLFTDGVIECRNASGEQFDTRRLISVIEDVATQGIDAVRDAIVKSCVNFMSKQDDDLTVLLMQKK